MSENEIVKGNSFVDDIKALISAGQITAYNTINSVMVMTYWSIGKRIVDEEQSGEKRAEYGTHLIPMLSEELTKEFGKGFSARNLHYYRRFYLSFPDENILNARVQNLTWTHFRSLLRVDDEDARIWYLKEASDENWSARTLDRNISTQYYNRLLSAPNKEKVIDEMKSKAISLPNKRFELLKSPVVAEFLGLKTEDSFLESDLENAILSHIRDFLMEMGRGFAFVGRQQHIVTDTEVEKSINVQSKNTLNAEILR